MSPLRFVEVLILDLVVQGRIFKIAEKSSYVCMCVCTCDVLVCVWESGLCLCVYSGAGTSSSEAMPMVISSTMSPKECDQNCAFPMDEESEGLALMAW